MFSPGGLVKKLFLVVAALALLACSLGPSFAQGVRKAQGTDSGAWSGECYSLEKLDLSAGQREALNRIDEPHKTQILKQRNSLMLKRIELRELLRDAGADKQAIRNKAGEMGDIREALQKEMIDYQIRIRDILTPEQIRRWCTLMGETFLQGGWKGD
jgi:Spy/CpxP family protein refolding chaperone